MGGVILIGSWQRVFFFAVSGRVCVHVHALIVEREREQAHDHPRSRSVHFHIFSNLLCPLQFHLLVHFSFTIRSRRKHRISALGLFTLISAEIPPYSQAIGNWNLST
jgi:hypothetical protein